MKKTISAILILSLLLAGCGAAQEPAAPATEPAATAAPTLAPTEPVQAPSVTVMPLPDTTMEALDDSIAAISLAEGAVQKHETGIVLMTMEVYTYDKYDLVDISLLKEGDILFHCGEEIPVTSLERTETGTVLINGGLDQDGLDLITLDDGVYFARGYSDMKSWYLAGEAVYELSDDFVYTDSANLDKEPMTFTAEDFLNGNPEIEYYFAPQSTTVRIQEGKIVAMDRVYTP